MLNVPWIMLEVTLDIQRGSMNMVWNSHDMLTGSQDMLKCSHRHDNMLPIQCYCPVEVSLCILNIYKFIYILRGSVDMLGDSQDMATDSQGMTMPHCETFTMSRETLSRSLETSIMSREK
jgi:hypothetical protein